MKRLVCFIVIVAVLSVTAFAENMKLSESAEKDLYNLGIMIGDGKGNLRLNDEVTRAELSKMICVALGYKDILASDLSVTEDFYDVGKEHWAYCYIQIASSLALIKGNDGYFNPNGNVTLEESIRAIICALGYKPEAEERGYIEVAEEIGLIESTVLKKDENTIREECAYLISICLDIPLLQQTSFGKNPQYAPMNGTNNTPLITLRTKLK